MFPVRYRRVKRVLNEGEEDELSVEGVAGHHVEEGERPRERHQVFGEGLDDVRDVEGEDDVVRDVVAEYH